LLARRGYQLLQTQVREGGALRLANFRLVRKLGSGASGEVSLVELGDSGHTFALKTVNKEDMVRRNKVNRVLTEDKVGRLVALFTVSTLEVSLGLVLCSVA
jgi:serine/threonine protein kinase